MFYFAHAPSSFPTFTRFPLYVQFREFYCYSPSTPLPIAEDEISFFNAFLPLGCRWNEDEVGCRPFRLVQWVETRGPTRQGSNSLAQITPLERVTRHFSRPET